MNNQIKAKTIPLDWSICVLGENSIIKGRLGWKGLKQSEYVAEGPYMIAGKHISNGKIKWAKCDQIPEDRYEESPEIALEIGDVIFSKDGSLGNPALITSLPGKATINSTMMLVRVDNKIRADFFYQILCSPYFKELIRERVSGSSIPHIFQRDMNEFKFPLPPLAEQQKIAEILSTVDEKLAVMDEQLVQTQELKKGLMQRLLTKGIGHTAFKESPLGEIPESWDVVRGEDVSSLISKGASPGWQGFDYTDEGLLFVTSENVKEGRLDISKPKFLPIAFNKKVAKSRLKNGDILINIVGASIGRACIYDSPYEFANVNQAVCVLRSNSRILNSFLLHALQSPETIKRLLGTQAGSARQNLSLSDIRAFMVVLPPLPEQHQIAEILTTIDDKLQVLTDKKSQYQELKRGLMQQLLTGQRRVQMAAEAVTA